MLSVCIQDENCNTFPPLNSELNFPDEDLEDGLYGLGDVLGNNDATTSNGEAMPCCHFDESVDVNEEKPIKSLLRLKQVTIGDQNKD